jgi:hypothetical protein
MFLPEDGVKHTETCREDLIKYVFDILCAFGWNIEEVFDVRQSTEWKTLNKSQ